MYPISFGLFMLGVGLDVSENPSTSALLLDMILVTICGGRHEEEDRKLESISSATAIWGTLGNSFLSTKRRLIVHSFSLISVFSVWGGSSGFRSMASSYWFQTWIIYQKILWKFNRNDIIENVKFKICSETPFRNWIKTSQIFCYGVFLLLFFISYLRIRREQCFASC